MGALDAATGKTIFELEEREVPASDVPGEVLAKTQPFSTVPPLASHKPLGPDDAFGLLWFDTKAWRKVLREYRSDGIFTPPTLGNARGDYVMAWRLVD